jgi:hypothetical protein
VLWSILIHSTYWYLSKRYTYRRDEWAKPISIQKAILFQIWGAVVRKVISLFIQSLKGKECIHDLGDRRGYSHLKEAVDRIEWRNRFGRGCGPVVWQITDDDDPLHTATTCRPADDKRYGCINPLKDTACTCINRDGMFSNEPADTSWCHVILWHRVNNTYTSCNSSSAF